MNRAFWILFWLSVAGQASNTDPGYQGIMSSNVSALSICCVNDTLTVLENGTFPMNLTITTTKTLLPISSSNLSNFTTVYVNFTNGFSRMERFKNNATSIHSYTTEQNMINDITRKTPVIRDDNYTKILSENITSKVPMVHEINSTKEPSENITSKVPMVHEINSTKEYSENITSKIPMVPETNSTKGSSENITSKIPMVPETNSTKGSSENMTTRVVHETNYTKGLNENITIGLPIPLNKTKYEFSTENILVSVSTTSDKGSLTSTVTTGSHSSPTTIGITTLDSTTAESTTDKPNDNVFTGSTQNRLNFTKVKNNTINLHLKVSSPKSTFTSALNNSTSTSNNLTFDTNIPHILNYNETNTSKMPVNIISSKIEEPNSRTSNVLNSTIIMSESTSEQMLTGQTVSVSMENLSTTTTHKATQPLDTFYNTTPLVITNFITDDVPVGKAMFTPSQTLIQTIQSANVSLQLMKNYLESTKSTLMPINNPSKIDSYMMMICVDKVVGSSVNEYNVKMLLLSNLNIPTFKDNTLILIFNISTIETLDLEEKATRHKKELQTFACWFRCGVYKCQSDLHLSEQIRISTGIHIGDFASVFFTFQNASRECYNSEVCKNNPRETEFMILFSMFESVLQQRIRIAVMSNITYFLDIPYKNHVVDEVAIVSTTVITWRVLLFIVINITCVCSMYAACERVKLERQREREFELELEAQKQEEEAIRIAKLPRKDHLVNLEYHTLPSTSAYLPSLVAHTKQRAVTLMCVKDKVNRDCEMEMKTLGKRANEDGNKDRQCATNSDADGGEMRGRDNHGAIMDDEVPSTDHGKAHPATADTTVAPVNDNHVVAMHRVSSASSATDNSRERTNPTPSTSKQI